MGDPTNDLVSPWQPMSRPIDLKHLGKLMEELGEVVTVSISCAVNGVNGNDPYTGKKLKTWFEDELADVTANIHLCAEHFQLVLTAPTSTHKRRRLVSTIISRAGVAVAAVSRCLIQGIDATEPTTGRSNRDWLQTALVDVLVEISRMVERFELDCTRIVIRAERKKENLRRWHQALD